MTLKYIVVVKSELVFLSVILIASTHREDESVGSSSLEVSTDRVDETLDRLLNGHAEKVEVFSILILDRDSDVFHGSNGCVRAEVELFFSNVNDTELRQGQKVRERVIETER